MEPALVQPIPVSVQAIGESNTNETPTVPPSDNNFRGYGKAKLIGLAILNTLGLILASLLVAVTSPLILLSLMITGPFAIAVMAKIKDDKAGLFATAIILEGIKYGSLFTVPLAATCFNNLRMISQL